VPKAHIKPFQLHKDAYQCLQIQLKQCLARALMINSSRKHIHSTVCESTHTHTHTHTERAAATLLDAQGNHSRPGQALYRHQGHCNRKG